MDLPVLQNPCGNCKACCTVLGVAELRKPDYVACQHECESGCGVYENRPTECRTYRCLYHSSFPNLPEEMRPDRLGAILEPTNTSCGMSIVIREIEFGVTSRSGFFEKIDPIARAIEAFYYVVLPNNTRNVLIPSWINGRRRTQIENVLFQYRGFASDEERRPIRGEQKRPDPPRDRDAERKKKKAQRKAKARNR